MIQHVLDFSAPREGADVERKGCPRTVSYVKHQIFYTVTHISVFRVLVPVNIEGKVSKHKHSSCDRKHIRNFTYRPGHVEA